MLQGIRNILNQGKFFLTPYFIVFIAATLALVYFSKSEIHIWINKHNSIPADIFFKYWTNVGDGIFVILVAVILLFRKLKHSAFVLATYICSGIFVQIFKHVIFSSAPRPKLYFEGIYNLHFVQGIEIHTNNSFPSGHSATAFALFLSLSFIFQNRMLQFLFFLIASLAAFSRIYLSQHFLLDATVGSLIGILVSLIYYYFHMNFKRDWMDKSIIQLIR